MVLPLLGLASLAVAAPKVLKATGKIEAGDGMLHDAFAFDETGSKFAYIKFTTQGKVKLLLGSPGGKPTEADIESFSSAPEKLLGLGGYWLVVSTEGQRRAAVVDAAGKIRRTTMAFDDCELSFAPKAFVLFSERMEGGSRRYTINAMKPDGGTLMLQDVVLEGSNTIAGGNGASFLGFTNSHLQAMVQVPGAYNAKADVRLPPQFAMYDVKTGKTSGAKLPPKLDNFLDYVRKRSEKPDQTAVIVLAAGQNGYELVGPGENVRPIDLTVPKADYDPTSLQQKQIGNKIVFSLIADRPGRSPGDMNETSRYAMGFFSLDPGTGKVTVIGEIPVAKHESLPFALGGNKLAVLRKNSDGNREIVIYAR